MARRRRPDSGAQGEGGGQEERGKREEDVGVQFPYLARAGVEQGGGAMRAGGGVACAGGWPRGAPIYRRGEAVEGEGTGRWPSGGH